jgi:hypothetical protein
LLAELRRRKYELIDLLQAETAKLPRDCTPWLHIARQVMAGEFDGGDRSLLGSLQIGLKNISHPACQAANARLKQLLGRWKGVRK